MPFATLVTGDRHDKASDLDRPDVYRLNIGVKKETYRALFGAQPHGPLGDVVDTESDYTALDRIMPHPIYASMSWVCVLNPSEETFETARELLSEAYSLAETTYAKRVNRGLT